MEQFRETLKIALKNCSNPQEIHNAIGNTIMSFISENWEKSKYSHYHSRRACYFSMEVWEDLPHAFLTAPLQ